MINYREEFLNDPKYADMPDAAKDRMAACICPGCGVMFSDNFHDKECPEIERLVAEGKCHVT